MHKYKIGYWPNTPTYNAAGDRRRFVFYAKERGFLFENASVEENYDIVYLTTGCNLSQWINYKKRNPQTKIIFEIIDSYLLESSTLYTRLRGPVRFITGKDSRLYFDYRKAMIKMLSVADAVVCSTPIQKDFILYNNKNVHVSLDYFSDDIQCHKQDYSTNSKLKIVWEGQSYTVENLLTINDALQVLKDEIDLHVITDPLIKYPLKIFNKKTEDILKNLKCDYTLHEWEKNTFSQLIARADLSIIPIAHDQKLMWNKPENKLLLLWEIGIPVFTSSTPAYRRVMEKAGIDGCCSMQNDWVKKITDFKRTSFEAKQNTMDLARNYLIEKHSKNEILKNWDAIFESVIY